MSFEDELKALIAKYNLGEVTISYKKTVTLSANSPSHVQSATAQNTSEEPLDPLAVAYARGPIAKLS